jgi:hypothetical protein
MSAQNGVFGTALIEMEAQGSSTHGPKPFQSYLSANSLPIQMTAPIISVDSFRRLAPELKKAGVMVFRLGSPKGERNTHFALSKYVDGWSDYFIFDEEIFASLAPVSFIPSVPVRHLFPFLLLPSFTEISLVNLAFASGLLAHALGIDQRDLPYAPATGQSTFDFPVVPHSKLGVRWQHQRGQVEIDAVFSAQRASRETVFLLEAKTSAKKGEEFDSLAKHKLMYPVLALRDHLPNYMKIIPIYLRAIRKPDGVHFYLAECGEISPEGEVPSIASLEVRKMQHLVLPRLIGA